MEGVENAGFRVSPSFGQVRRVKVKAHWNVRIPERIVERRIETMNCAVFVGAKVGPRFPLCCRVRNCCTEICVQRTEATKTQLLV